MIAEYSSSVARFLRFLAKGVNLSVIYCSTLSLTLSLQGKGIFVSIHFPEEP
jgi:hypothetical protein